MTIGERILMLRKQNHMTLEDVANYIDVKRATVSRYETGQITNIPSDKIELLSKLFNVSPAFLMGWKEGSDEPPDIPQTPEARILSKGIDKMPREQREKAIAVMKAVFSQYADYFKGDGSNDTT